MIANILVKRLNALKNSKSNWNNVCQDITDYILPNRGGFIASSASYENNVPRSMSSVPVQALEELASIIFGRLTSPNTSWFSFTVKNPKLQQNIEVKRWIEAATEIVQEEFYRAESNFSSQNHQALLDLLAYGTACMYVEERDKGFVTFSTIHMGHIYLLENAQGLVDTVVREFKMTGRQLAQQFGEDKVIELMKENILDEIDELHCVYHFVMPVEDYERIGGRLANKKFKFASIYVVESEDDLAIIKEGGFYELPMVVSRWATRSGEVYGYSPTWLALPDIKQLSVMEESIIRTTQLQTEPILLVSDDSLMSNIEFVPNTPIYGGLSADGTPRISQLPIQANNQLSLAIAQKKEESIRNAYFLDQLTFPNRNTYMTATEASYRQEDKLALTSPQIARLQNEYLRPLIERVFKIKQRSGLLPEIPEVLRGQEIQISYISPLGKIQKRQEAMGTSQWMQVISPFVQANPTLLDVIDTDKLAAYLADSFGLPDRVLRGEQEIGAIREQRAYAQQQQQQLQNLQQLSGVGADLAKASSLTTKQ